MRFFWVVCAPEFWVTGLLNSAPWAPDPREDPQSRSLNKAPRDLFFRSSRGSGGQKGWVESLLVQCDVHRKQAHSMHLACRTLLKGSWEVVTRVINKVAPDRNSYIHLYPDFLSPMILRVGIMSTRKLHAQPSSTPESQAP